jgi:hypothetical protein
MAIEKISSPSLQQLKFSVIKFVAIKKHLLLQALQWPK